MSAPKHIAQSEVNAWATCPFQAWTRYHAGVFRGFEENLAQRVGSMGHAILAERARARVAGRPMDIDAAVAAEAKKREWGEVSADEVDVATAAAERAAWEVDLDSLQLVPDLWGETPGPLVDTVVRVPWDMLQKAYLALGCAGAAFDIMSCAGLRETFAGIEGHPDLVSYSQRMDDRGARVVITDWKFRQRADLGGAARADIQVPDRQFAFYAILLYALGVRPSAGFELQQVNVFAGRYATVEDFLRVADGGARTQAEGELITSSWLPSSDLSRIDRAGYAVTTEVWQEAHRALANRRHATRLEKWKQDCEEVHAARAAGSRRRVPEPPPILSAAETESVKRMVRALDEWSPVHTRSMRHELVVCAEVVRDMLVGVDGHLGRFRKTGATPPRNLQAHPTSTCMRPGSCPVRGLCLAHLGTFGAGEAAKRAGLERVEELPDFGGELSSLVIDDV